MLMGADIISAQVDPSKWSAQVTQIGDEVNGEIEVTIYLANNIQDRIPLKVKLPLGIDDPQGFLEREVAEFIFNSDRTRETKLRIVKGLDIPVKPIGKDTTTPPSLTPEEQKFVDEYSNFKRYSLIAPRSYDKGSVESFLLDELDRDPTLERFLYF